MAPQYDFEDAALHNTPKDLQEVSRLLDLSDSGGAGDSIDIERCRWDGGFGTPLMEAISRGNMEMAQLLLDRGADCDARYREGRHHNRAVVHVAMSSGPHRGSWARVVGMLALKGVNVDVLDSTGSNLLHYILAGSRDGAAHDAGKLAWVLANSKDRETLLSERNTFHAHTPRELAEIRGAHAAAVDLLWVGRLNHRPV
jgi:hypothetical protein